MSHLLDICDISCSYDSEMVVHNLSFHVEAGDNICLLGPSGCGKTTTLRAIAGFEPLVSGSISLAGSLLSKPGFTLSPERRQLGMVFQDYALFPHLTVADNIRFGLTSGSRQARQQRVEEMLELTELSPHAHHMPQELSGGQQQRVALARALAPAPRLILLDEPFSNLDAGLRQNLSHEVRLLLKKTGTSAIMVTHDQEEAFAFADQIGLFEKGRLAQWGTARDLYQQPANSFVADFIGEGSLINAQRNATGQLETSAGTFIPATSLNATEQTILLRPDQIICDPQQPHTAQVLQTSFRGRSHIVKLRLNSGEELLVETPTEIFLSPGSTTGIRSNNTPVAVFPK